MATGSFAFGGLKEGFVLGGGLGVHTTSFEESVDLGYFGKVSGSGSKQGLATDFLVGYDFNESFVMLYENTDAWYWGNGATFYDAIGPLAFRYYFHGDEPGFFLGASGILGSFVT